MPDFRLLLEQQFLRSQALEAKLRALEQRRHEPIAIVGIGCRFPGGEAGPDAFWQSIREGVDAVREIPEDRWPRSLLSDPATRWAGTLERIDSFDAEFFGIAPLEAASVDPQQRLLLEVAWEALEHAAIAPDGLVGTATGVFVGLATHDYQQLCLTLEDRDAAASYSGVGGAGPAAAGRLSYVLGLQGPSLVVETACSSSLVAVHLACQSLRQGESDTALAGGANLICSPFTMRMLAGTQALSPDGRCRVFDARANGFVRGEGAGLVVLRRLSDAQRDGDRIWSVIRGSAVNQDGRSTGLTVPNVRAQVALLRQALKDARVDPGQIAYVEAHGTGTSLGDPIEVEALNEVIGRPRPDGSLCALGSVKANIGHLEGAAGIAGLIKCVMALNDGTVPPLLHFRHLNPRISLEGGALAVSTEAWPLPGGDEPCIAGVSSFGITGTNAHVIIERPPSKRAAEAPEGSTEVVLLSARTPTALIQQARALARRLGEATCSLTDAAFTSATGRAHLPHRLAVVASRSADAAQTLQSFADDPASSPLPHGEALAGGRRPRIAFLFSGQGSQYPGMGTGLYRTEPVFRAAIDACDEQLRALCDFGVKELLFTAGADELDRTLYTQPALFALEYGLAALWRSWGVEPEAVLGHSVGEYAAACLAGVFDLPTALRLIASRARRMDALPAGGSMAAVFAEQAVVEAVLARHPGLVAIAAMNGPRSLVISGDAPAVSAVCDELTAQGIKSRPLRVSHAFHSHRMEPMLAGFDAELAQAAFQPAQLPIANNLTGALSRDALSRAAYWREQVRQPVRFESGLRALLAEGIDVLVEIGPHPSLVAHASEASFSGAGTGLCLPSLRRDHPDEAVILGALASLHVRGVPVHWRRFHETRGGKPTSLPTYPFERSRHWTSSPPPWEGQRHLATEAGPHPWLSRSIRLAGHEGEQVFTGRVSPTEQPWLLDHVVLGLVLLPGAAFLELALAVGRALNLGAVAELTLLEPLVLAETGAVRLQIVAGAPDARGRRHLSVFSQPEDGAQPEIWTHHASGELMEEPARPDDGLAALRAWPPAGAEARSVGDFYEKGRAMGFEYGPAFRGLIELWRSDDTAYGRVVLPAEARAAGARHLLHPAALDAVFQMLGSGLERAGLGLDEVLLPFLWSDVSLRATGATELRVSVQLSRGGGSEPPSARVLIADSAGEAVATVGKLQLRVASSERLRSGRGLGAQPLFALSYQPVELTASTASEVVVLGPPGALGLASVPTLDAWLSQSGGHRPLVIDATQGSTRAALGTSVEALTLLQRALTDPRLAGVSCVWVTRQAISTSPDEGVANLSQAALWGLLRSARAEHPDRVLRLLDVGPGAPDRALLLRALRSDDQPELALREKSALVPRLVPASAGEALEVPATGNWRLGTRQGGPTSDLVVLEGDPPATLGAGQARVRIRASGLNFRDVLSTLEMVRSPALGFEHAGVVVELGPGVAHLRVGDRVMGLGLGTFGTEVCVDARLLVRIPAALTFAEAATVPLAFLTALYGLQDLARLSRGQRVLVHAAAGGVGMAALQLARLLGAEVFATASPAKWSTLRSLGLTDEHIASSRDLSFADRWVGAAAGRGMDVVLNSLSGDFIDASLRLLPKGGCFVEMGNRDLRDPAAVRAAHAGVEYRAFQLLDAGPERIQELLVQLAQLFTEGALRPLPFSAYDARHAPHAFRFMAQARHTGKLVLTVPRPLNREGTVLLTGGTGELGQAIAEHCVSAEGVRHLVLLSRRGPDAPGAAALVSRLERAGAVSVRIVACDVSKRGEVAAVLAAISAAHPLTAVIHLAGALDDARVEEQSAGRFERVMSPKLDGALHLHELTRGADLAAFLLFSSAAGTLGSPGQSNYAAANTFLDGLAAERRKRGLPGMSLAWGLWKQAGIGMTSHLNEADLGRIQRQGLAAMTVGEGLGLFGAALARPEALLVPIKLDIRSAQRELEQDGHVPALLRPLIPRRAQPGSSPQALPVPRGREQVTELVRSEVRRVLGHAAGVAIPDDKGFFALGMDSLMAAQLAKRLSTCIQAPVSVVTLMEHPTIAKLSRYLADEVLKLEPEPLVEAPEDDLEDDLSVEELSRMLEEKLKHS